MTPEQLPECWQPAATAAITHKAERRRRDTKRRAIAANRKRKAECIAFAVHHAPVLALALNAEVSSRTRSMAGAILDGREIDALGRVLPRRDARGRFKSEEPGGNPAPK